MLPFFAYHELAGRGLLPRFLCSAFMLKAVCGAVCGHFVHGFALLVMRAGRFKAFL